MNHQINSSDICVIRTFECELCLRFDSIMMPKEELSDKVNNNSMGIGTHLIGHGDHNRIIYFNEQAEYLGDIISLNLNKTNDLETFPALPIFTKKQNPRLRSFQSKIQKMFISKTSNICIVGPSFAGKTSLTLFLETGIPERFNGYTRRSPTLHKSIKHIKLGKTKLSIFDMGGQRDFWNGWKDVIPSSEKIIFIIDGTANNADECAEALDLVLSKRSDKVSVLLLINKFDLVIDRYTEDFISDKEIISRLKIKEINNISMIRTSIFNGINYNYNNLSEETSLIEVLTDFIDN